MNIKNKFLWLCLFLSFFSLQIFSQNAKTVIKKERKISNEVADTSFSQFTEITELENKIMELKKQSAKKDSLIKGLTMQKTQLTDKIAMLEKNSIDWVSIILCVVFFLISAYLIVKYKIIDKIVDYFKVRQEETELYINSDMQKSNTLKNDALKNVVNVTELNKPQ